MNKYFLFDMDGTLTDPRCVIEDIVVDEILSLLTVSKVGIVTGSDFNYVQEQCDKLFKCGKHSPKLFMNLTIFPCNGTKSYTWDSITQTFVYKSSTDMIELVGQDTYNKVLQQLLTYQLEICLSSDLPYTGTFLHYRGSMLNWCPVGRSADTTARQSWVLFDKEKKIRQNYLERLEQFFKNQNFDLVAALGGSTSFDIYPLGWDKTYVLKHVEGHELIFIGDKCKPGGNDYTIYSALKAADKHQSYSTSSPAETIRIIKNCISH